MERIDIDPEGLPPGRFYGMLAAIVVPRPIAWVSSRSAEGVDNLAPHSFFTVASVDPPVILFTSVGRKDSLNNIEATREFVVCLTPGRLIKDINYSATNFPPGTSEFDAVGIAREPSLTVAPPRVAESPVALECELHSTVPFGESTVVMGHVKHAAIDASAFRDGHIDVRALDPIGRLAGNDWVHLGEIESIRRLAVADWPPPEQG